MNGSEFGTFQELSPVPRPNEKLQRVRERTPSPVDPSRGMSRAEFAAVVSRDVFGPARMRHSPFNANYVGKLERGQITWPQHPYRLAMRRVTKVGGDRLQSAVQGLARQGGGLVRLQRHSHLGLERCVRDRDRVLKFDTFSIERVEINIGAERFECRPDTGELISKRLGSARRNEQLAELGLVPSEGLAGGRGLGHG